MGKKARTKSVAKLQKIYDYLGKYGGTIETKKPGNWWKFYMDTDPIGELKVASQIGVCKDVNGDTIFDPLFHIVITLDEDNITEVEINDCEETTMFGTSVVDANDMISMNGMKEKDDYGLIERFESFMTNMAEVGPYLTDPKKVCKYDKYLSE